MLRLCPTHNQILRFRRALRTALHWATAPPGARRRPLPKRPLRGRSTMTQSNTTIPAGSVQIDGVPYLRNAQGDLQAVANIKPMDLLMDEMVRKVVGYAEDLSAELVRFAAHTDADIAGLDALLAQEYGVEPRETKGNRTFTSFDGLMKVQVAVSERIVLGPELQAAKAVLDAMILERGEGVDPFLLTLVKRAFKVDQEGKVDVRAILALRRMQVDDARWADFCRAIDDAVRVVGSKRYIRIYRRERSDGQWRMIPLDLAAVEPTPAAFERMSLRRRVEELEAEIARMTAEEALADAADFKPVTDLDRLVSVTELVSMAVDALKFVSPIDDAAADEIADAAFNLTSVHVAVGDLVARVRLGNQAAE